MCGICGFYNLNNKKIASQKTLKEMTDSLYHRGPDDLGHYVDKKIGLGFRRLKIIDLSKRANQPMWDINKEICIVFNGEIFNYLEIKEKLEKKGYKFQSKSDTEVIIYSFVEWGIKCLEKFNGQFAMALYDKKNDLLYLIRDRLGIKPLFYTIQYNTLIFASEIKAILKYPKVRKEPNWKAISSYLSYRYVLGEETLFKNIFQVLPAHYLLFQNKKKSVKEYWDIPLNSHVKMSREQFVKKTKELLTQSVRYRMISDVPIGAYLSGGLDSSIIVAIMARESKEKVKTYSIGFKQKEFNELKFAEQVAQMYSTNHKEIIVNAKKYLETMETLISNKDAPLSVPNEVVLYLMSKELKKDITVVLSGEGADEIFYGYGRLFRSPFDYARLKIIPKFLRNILTKSLYKKYGDKKIKNQLEHFLYQYNYFPLSQKKKIYNNYMNKLIENDLTTKEIFKKYFDRAKEVDYYKKISYCFEKIHLVGLLGRVDNSTMATSVEARVPFVDHKLVEFLFTVPLKYKLKWKSFLDFIKSLGKNADEISETHDTTKYILREAFKDFAPHSVLTRKKKGFPVPLDIWFKSEFIEYAKNILLNPKARIKKIFDQKKLEEWVDDNIRDNNDSSFGQKIWMILNIEIWLKKYF